VRPPGLGFNPGAGPGYVAGPGPGGGGEYGRGDLRNLNPAPVATGPIDASIIARQKMAAAPAATTTATPVAPVAPASRFVQIARPNAPPMNLGGLRGSGGPLQMSALDLSGLFNRAQSNPAAAAVPPAPSAPVPAQGGVQPPARVTPSTGPLYPAWQVAQGWPYNG
jgi:hypothetical protein